MAGCSPIDRACGLPTRFLQLSGVGVDSQKNEVAKSEKDAETSYHCCAEISSKAEQSAIRQAGQESCYGYAVNQRSMFKLHQFSSGLKALACSVIAGSLAIGRGEVKR